MDRSTLEELLATMLRMDAAAAHLIAGRPPCLRVQGKLVLSEAAPVSAVQIEELVREFLFEDHRQRLNRGEEVEILYMSRAGVRFRTLIAQQCDGLSVMFRRVPLVIPSFEQLGLPELLGAFVSFRSGLIVLSGFLGSGKSTTLAALVDRVIQQSPRHVVTLEDPIEFVHQNRLGVVHQREIGVHVDSMVMGVRDALRAGADTLVVGELRDYETLVALLDAVERGCLVLTTTNSSSVVTALADMFALAPPDQTTMVQARIASALRVLIGQTLLRRSHGSGKVPLLEILINNPSVVRILRSGDVRELPAAMERHRGLGMQTIDAALRQLLNRNLITVDEALYHAIDRSWLAGRVSAGVAAR